MEPNYKNYSSRSKISIISSILSSLRNGIIKETIILLVYANITEN